MNLEELLARAEEIESAIVNAAGQLNALHGHKVEIQHWISRLQIPADAPQVELPSEPVIE